MSVINLKNTTWLFKNQIDLSVFEAPAGSTGRSIYFDFISNNNSYNHIKIIKNSNPDNDELDYGFDSQDSIVYSENSGWNSGVNSAKRVIKISTQPENEEDLEVLYNFLIENAYLISEFFNSIVVFNDNLNINIALVSFNINFYCNGIKYRALNVVSANSSFSNMRENASNATMFYSSNLWESENYKTIYIIDFSEFPSKMETFYLWLKANATIKYKNLTNLEDTTWILNDDLCIEETNEFSNTSFYSNNILYESLLCQYEGEYSVENITKGYLVYDENTFPYDESYAIDIGDINEDHQINSSDLTLLNNFLNGTIQLNNGQQKLADINQNNIVNSEDYTLLSNGIQNDQTNFGTITAGNLGYNQGYVPIWHNLAYKKIDFEGISNSDPFFISWLSTRASLQLGTLEDTKWYFEDPLNLDDEETISFNLNFISDTLPFTSITSKITSTSYSTADDLRELNYDDVLVYNKPESGLPSWTNENYRAIEIISGEDVNNLKAIQWIQKYAQPMEASSIETVLTNLKIHTVPNFNLWKVLYQNESIGENDIVIMSPDAWEKALKKDDAKDVFMVIYGETTYDEVMSNFLAGKICILTYRTSPYDNEIYFLFKIKQEDSISKFCFICFDENTMTNTINYKQILLDEQSGWNVPTSVELVSLDYFNNVLNSEYFSENNRNNIKIKPNVATTSIYRIGPNVGDPGIVPTQKSDGSYEVTLTPEHNRSTLFVNCGPLTIYLPPAVGVSHPDFGYEFEIINQNYEFEVKVSPTYEASQQDVIFESGSNVEVTSTTKNKAAFSHMKIKQLRFITGTTTDYKGIWYAEQNTNLQNIPFIIRATFNIQYLSVTVTNPDRTYEEILQAIADNRIIYIQSGNCRAYLVNNKTSTDNFGIGKRLTFFGSVTTQHGNNLNYYIYCTDNNVWSGETFSMAESFIVNVTSDLTLDNTHRGRVLYCKTNGVTITIPNKTFAFGFECEIMNGGGYEVTIKTPSNVKINGIASSTYDIPKQYTSGVLKAIDTTSTTKNWILQGAYS